MSQRQEMTLPASAVDRVYESTRNAILVGDFPPGTPLRVQELADRNGVSTIPVRESLRRLEAERLVESVANKGARVAELSFPDLADAYRLRTVLEVEAVRLAAGWAEQVSCLTWKQVRGEDELMRSGEIRCPRTRTGFRSPTSSTS